MIPSDAADDPCHRDSNTFSRLVTPPAAVLLVFFAWVSLSFGAMSDRDIETAIDTRLSRDDAVRAQSIEVTVREGVATLDGSTPTLAAADRAERVAMAVRFGGGPPGRLADPEGHRKRNALEPLRRCRRGERGGG